MPRGLQPQSHMFSDVGDPGLEAAEEILEAALVGNIRLHVGFLVCFPIGNGADIGMACANCY